MGRILVESEGVMETGTVFLLLARLFGGVGVFLVGVHLLTTNLEQLAAGRIRDLFRRIADNNPSISGSAR